MNWTKILNPFDDLERNDYTLEKVEPEGDNYYSVSFDGGWQTTIQSPKIIPRVGDTFTVWGLKFGLRRGFAINDEVVQYLTQEQQEAKFAQDQRDREEQQKVAYEEKIDDHNNRITDLPDVFQERIQRFRNYSPDWGWKYEGYELFVCEEAIKMHEFFADADAIREWYELPYDEQNSVYVASDEHSGNTFAKSARLALMYKEAPELIPKEHGALCALVGCKEYGCYAASKDKGD